jgi:hypothetical protein
MAQCALCRESLAKGGSDGLVRGFYWSIVLITSVPFLLLGGLGLLVFRHRPDAIEEVDDSGGRAGREPRGLRSIGMCT